MKKLLLYAAMFAAVVCCTPKEDPEEPVDPVDPVETADELSEFSATIEDIDTKTYLSEYTEGGIKKWHNYWKADDQIKINGSTSNAIDNTSGAGTSAAKFHFSSKVRIADGGNYYCAAYPSDAVSNHTSSGTATITVPTRQANNYSYDPSAYIMLSKRTDNRLHFAPQMAVIKINPADPTSGTKSITYLKIESMGTQNLSGTFSTNYSSISGGTCNYVDASYGGVSFADMRDLLGYFTIPANTYSQGIRITITASEETMVVTNPSSVTFLAGKLYAIDLPAFKASSISITNCVALSSSSVSLRWQSASTTYDTKKAWKIHVYSDPGCSTEVKNYVVPTGNETLWNGNDASNRTFVVGGLNAGTTYYFKVEDMTNGTLSAASSATTEAFSTLAVQSISSTGDILREDFSEITWGSSPITTAVGRDVSGSFQTASGRVSFADASLNSALSSTRLSSWGIQGPVTVAPGYVSIGDSSTSGYILTPAFTGTSGKVATVSVEVRAARASASSETTLAAKVIHTSTVSGRTATSVSDQNYYRTASISGTPSSSTSPNWQTITFSNLEIAAGDRIMIGPVDEADASGSKQCFYINHVKINASTITTGYNIFNTQTLDEFVTEVDRNNSVNGTVTSSFTYSGSWGTPIGTFSGTLEGGGYTITGLDAPLIDNLIGGTIQNLTLNSTITDTSTSGFTGMFVNTMDRSDHATEDGKLNTYPLLDHCISQGSITANPSSSLTGQKGIAGLVGVVGTVDEANVDNGRFIYCSNEATVSFVGTIQHSKKIWVGGLVARHRMGKTVNDCTNSGSVSSSANSTDEIYVGGLFGSARGYGGSGRVNLRRCTNTGTVTNTGVGTDNGFPSVGGLIGYSSNRVTVQYTSKNEGSILEASNSKYVSVGGITGQTTNEQVRLAGTNSGTITIVGSHCRPYVGGIVGFLSQGSLEDDSHYASNSGNIVINTVTIADDGATKGCYYIGGLIGYFNYATDQTFSNLSFTGQIKTANTTCSDVTCTTASENIIFVGGIAAGGENTSGKQFSNCTVTQTGANTSFSLYCNVKLVLGGIVGQSALCPTNCSVNCDMTIRRTDTTAGTESNIGGIVGNCDAATYSNLLYEGTLDARNDDTSTYTVAKLGGIVGVGPDAAVTFSNCAVGGSVKGSKSGDVCGLFIQAQSTSNTVAFDTTSPCKVKTGTYHYGKNSNLISDSSKLTNNIVRGTRASSTVSNLSSIVVTSPISL